jgi:hypothetical protein
VGSRAPSDRYQPLPGLLEIPGFLLGKLSPRGRRIAAVVGALLGAAVIVGLVLGVPALIDAKHRSALADARRDARYRASRIGELTRQVRPIAGRGPAARGPTSSQRSPPTARGGRAPASSSVPRSVSNAAGTRSRSARRIPRRSRTRGARSTHAWP